jgi:Tfp pilus assembly protein PilO
MRRNELNIVVGLLVVGLLAAFWFVIYSPKKQEASQLQDQIDGLNASLSQAQQEVADAEQARKSFGIDYRRLVVLGKAVPADSDQSSLLVQLQHLADRSGVQFQTFDLNNSGGGSTPPPTTSTTSTSSSDSSSSSTTSTTDSTTTSTDSTTTTADPTEAAVSTLPIGASVGPAGLPIMPYTLGFTGDFFQIANFMKRVDSLVGVRDGRPDVKGRLLTVDGFTLSLAPDAPAGSRQLTAALDVTSFVAPADQGITGGATPSGPAPATSTPVSSTTTTPSSTTTTPSSTTTAPSTSSTSTDTTAATSSTPTGTAP